MGTKPLALFLMGPTGTGKTDLALAIADAIPSRIISVDSALVYRDMNIGTAKPDRDRLVRYPHALVDICDPAQSYSVARFLQDARNELSQAVKDGRLPLFVGGTMLYFKALKEGLSELPSADAEIRSVLAGRAREEGWPALHQQLSEVDPETAAALHPNHSARIQRALEVWMLTGVALSDWHQRGSVGGISDLVDTVDIALLPRERGPLHERLAQRLDQMMEAGLVEEVQSLRNRQDLGIDLPSMRAVGYRQVWNYLEGEFDETAMREQILAATRQLAKRQITWLRSWDALKVVDPLDTNKNWRMPEDLLRDCLKFL